MISRRFFLKVKRLNVATFSNVPEKVVLDEHFAQHQRNIQKYDERADKFGPKFLQRMEKRYTLAPRKKVDFSALTLTYPKVPAIVEYATKELRFLPEQIFAVFEATPELADIAPAKWATCFEHLSQYGFGQQGILKMAMTYPDLLQLDAKQLEDAMHSWMRCQFGEAELLPLLVDNPYFLKVPEEVLNYRIPRIRLYLEGRKKRVIKILMNSPQIMFKNWDQVQNIMDYLTEPMRIPISQVARSGVFRYDLFHLRVRFLFLHKAGVYKIRSYKADPLETPKHPQLTDIVDSHEQKFVYKVAGLSLIEFQVFKDLLYAEEICDDRDFLKPPDTYDLINPYLVTDLRNPNVRIQKKRPKPQAPVVE